MLDNEDRNCGCMNNYNNMMGNPGNMMNSNYSNSTSFMNSNNNMSSCECDQFNQTREDMLERIKCLNFAIIELALYLDTHPEDERALCLHRKYSKDYREITDKYQKVYGPLTIKFPCNRWRWLEESWPWEGGNF